MSPQRIQRQRVKGWRKPEGAIYVGRGNHWGNPYTVEDHGRQGSVDLYEADLRHSWAGAGIYKKLRDELRGKDLMCWCRLDQPCHADVLLKLANKDPR